MSNTPDVPTAANAKAETNLERISLQSLVGKFVALTGLAYGVGFAVIMTHTAKLNVPVVEALQWQNIVAGSPIWLLICVGVWSWPGFVRRIMGDRITLSDSLRKGLTTVAVSLGVLLPGALWAGAKTPARDLPASLIVLGLSGIVFIFTITMVVQAQRIRWQDPGVRPLFQLICFWSGFVCFVIAYALFIYPEIPQSLGGGHPVRVRLLVKDREVANQLSQEDGQASSGGEPDVVLLYYRTSSYLLVSRFENRPLIQVPTDQIRAIVWLESRSQ
jgi:hypothetical protein